MIFSRILKFFTKRKDSKIENDSFPNIVEELCKIDLEDESRCSIVHKNKDLLCKCCLLSALVYQYKDPEHIKEQCAKWNITEYFIDTDNAQLVYGIFKLKNDVFLSFKGSSSLDDFLTDVNFIKVDDDLNIPGRMHKGFRDLLFGKDLHKDILDELKKFKYDNLYITGHSLGGALATLFFSYIKRFTYCSLVTFGSPKVGDKEFCENIRGVRVTNGNDIVPKIYIPFSYKHMHKVYRLGVCNFYRFSVSDHAVINYYKNLQLLE